MRVRRFRAGHLTRVGAVGLSVLIVLGCSREEELKLDPGVSPFFPGEAGSAPGPAGPVGAAESAPAAPEAPLRPEEVERQLRIALRGIEKGDVARASRTLDRILAVDPLNREALVGRATVALDQARRATATPERATALEQALGPVRALRRATEKPTKREADLFGRVLYTQAQIEVSRGQQDRALAVLREAYDGGFDPFDQVEKDPAMASLRASEGYRALLRSLDEANLVKARQRIKGLLDKPLSLAFDFTLPDLDGKPVALGQLRGQVVLIDIWGTWCKPCREAIPGLIQLYRKHHRRGFEIVGMDYEQHAPDQPTAVQMVKQFVQAAGIPYRCVMGDQATLEKIPNFRGFPTTMVIDRSGKVRMLITENSAGTPEMLDDAVAVLLAEPAPQAGGSDKTAKPK
ncbi:MAG TPA: redoxin domain-containing protein [Isosphaeraceae bacterium]|nr:redoxin domain-containing protein [Isosphaeraceae bacterium]